MTGSWPTDMPRHLDYPRCGADAILAGAAHTYPDRVALRDGDLALTYAELHDQALRIAAGLRQRGIEPGDVVGLHMPNSVWFMVAYYGALCAGAAVAPINPAQPVGELRRQLKDCAVRAVFTDPTCAANILTAQDESADARVLVVVPATAAGGADAKDSRLVPIADLLAARPLTGYRVDPELVAHLQLTGGTTGRSKAVRVLHRNLVAAVLHTACWRTAHIPALDAQGGLGLVPVPGAQTPYSLIPGASVSVAIAPLFHGLGLVSQNANTLIGATVVLSGGRFDPDRFLADVDRHGVTYIAGSPAMYYALLQAKSLPERDLTSVRSLGSGAAPLDPTAIRDLRTAFPRAQVAEGYGLSEATMGLTMAPLSETIEPPLGSVGVPLFDTEIQIRGEDRVSVLDKGQTGEIWARGPQIADGYQSDPELTARQWVAGWLYTGDMGRLDESGNLYIVGRAKDMIIYKGYNVYPQPLEELVCSHPDVAQAAVVGAPSISAGEVPVAFVVVRPGVRVDHAELGRSIMEHVGAQVVPYQRVRAVHIVEALPTTTTGKILKSQLRESLPGQE
ncbi:class I adenylate-forming enzyme family protein [Nocardia sp. A7]|uniref:class I adenylate-forming enzyme family protein n=1 Tax=Nocardia sp. A7 TaxID=2789274 RepID=UPI00397AC528